MASANFHLKPEDALSSRDFNERPLWAGYYEPDDVDDIVRWGVPEAEVRAALDEVGWADDHYFPLPVEAARSYWMRGKLYAVTATLPDGTEHTGYVGEDHSYLAVFTEGGLRVASDLFPEIDHGLALPIRVNNRVTGEQWTFARASIQSPD
ncbi:hypothetical protein HNP52_002924 [Sphingomonas kyeonggiensis]|uniref:Uncharacterized protein n=1 Tax=Sphingomonas kyeonggiensis TaxID=1268553 RepID=A0A7W7K324_9SPHN|nr:hypothetical protein [Sphingomonas kyeonggiensis]MBB4839832.1 hypothetical protein [Sphingomonas kyeonggiensis]